MWCGRPVASIVEEYAPRNQAARMLRYIFQKSPTVLPTTILFSTGTNVNMRIDTSGQSFKPAMMSGRKS